MKCCIVVALKAVSIQLGLKTHNPSHQPIIKLNDNGDDNFAEGETNTISFDSQENAKGVIPSSEVREWWEIDSEEDTEFDVFDLDLDNISIFDEEESIEDAEESYENMEYNDDGGDDVEDNTMEER
ncbi:hypothetical protein UCRPC4_g02098 [Phaeomoniella chlamydospora]|uniref:Uncharacterized protein n=1 Tax=Phaeomoniella chlamydospora TaxID=158046 RepID=A0A0G2ESA4_PHACM|nr:hypothetical protein UCRPC4_g02098 [Phaeomoniella chlamydospora]